MLLPSSVEIRPPVPKKNFEEFLPYIGIGVILVSGNLTQVPRTIFRSSYPKRPHKNLALIGQAVSDKMFETVDDVRGRRTDAGTWVYYKLTIEPSAQVS